MGVWQDHFHWRIIRRWEVLGWIIATLLAIGGIVLFFDQYWLANICFIFGASLVAAKAIDSAVATEGSVTDRVVFAVVLCCAIVVLTYFSANGLLHYRDKKNTEQKLNQPLVVPNPSPTTQQAPPEKEQPPVPDLIAEFIEPADLELVISNPSRATAHQPTFGTFLIDLDNPTLEVLPIGRQTGDFLRPQASLLRIPLLHYGTTAVLDQIKPGHRIFGWMSLSCADCKQIRWYWIYYEYMKGGWYAETLKEPVSGDLAKVFPRLADGSLPIVDFAHPKKMIEIKSVHGIVRYPEQGTLR